MNRTITDTTPYTNLLLSLRALQDAAAQALGENNVQLIAYLYAGADDELINAIAEAAHELAIDVFFGQRCRVCGCTDDEGCPEGCWWSAGDLCSRCVDRQVDAP